MAPSLPNIPGNVPPARGKYEIFSLGICSLETHFLPILAEGVPLACVSDHNDFMGAGPQIDESTFSSYVEKLLFIADGVGNSFRFECPNEQGRWIPVAEVVSEKIGHAVIGFSDIVLIDGSGHQTNASQQVTVLRKLSHTHDFTVQ